MSTEVHDFPLDQIDNIGQVQIVGISPSQALNKPGHLLVAIDGSDSLQTYGMCSVFQHYDEGSGTCIDNDVDMLNLGVFTKTLAS